MKTRPGDQPLPHGSGPDMYLMVSEDLKLRIFLGFNSYTTSTVIRDLEARKQVGITRYGEPLKAWNGRSARRDLHEELLDAVVYAKQNLVECSNERLRLVLEVVYNDVLHALLKLTVLMIQEEQGS